MNSVNKILLIVLISITGLFGQITLDDQYNYASGLYLHQKYFDAITELKRLQFFDKDKLFEYESNLLIGQSYKCGGMFDEASKYFVLAELSSKTDEEYYISRILNARANILRRTTSHAEQILMDLLSNKKFEPKKNEINYWLGWNAIFSDDWEKAYRIFSASNTDTVLANLCKSVDNEMYSVDFAKYSSYILPGTGQFYTKEYISGLLSLGWNILSGYLTINAFTEDRIFDGIIVGNFLWMRFYSGNIQNAEKFAVQKNLEISNRALRYLHGQYTGNKP